MSWMIEVSLIVLLIGSVGPVFCALIVDWLDGK
jgi:hypothetical protein